MSHDAITDSLLSPAPHDETSPDLAALHVTCRLGHRDLYWAYETSRPALICTLVFVALGLLLLSSALAGPPDRPVAADVEVGVISLILALLLAPAVLIWMTRGLSSARAGSTIRLRFAADGIEGWVVPMFRETTWQTMRHPRMESRVLVLPFSWPFADAWVIVPARALTPHQFDGLVAMLRSQGFFADGDHRSRIGQLMSLLFDHGPAERDGHLTRFPRLAGSERQGGTKPGEGPLSLSASDAARARVPRPSIVIGHSGLSRILHAPPLLIGDDWIKVPLHPTLHWSEIARIDMDPMRPIVLRLWTFAEGRPGGEVNSIPIRVGLRGYSPSPSEVRRVIEEQFNLWRSREETEILPRKDHG